MSILAPSPSVWTPRMLAVYRIMAGVLFVLGGTMKLFGFPQSPVPMPPLDLTSQIGIGGLLELFGGAAIVLGLLVRPVSFVLAGMMAVAYFQFHAPQAFFPSSNGGIPAIMFCFLFLYLMLAGGGAWTLDAVLARRRARAVPSRDVPRLRQVA
jgi:putative oxidoreductase